MKKILTTMILLGVLMFGVGGVLAVDQDVEGTIVSLTLNPDELDFGNLLPGSVAVESTLFEIDTGGFEINAVSIGSAGDIFITDNVRFSTDESVWKEAIDFGPVILDSVTSAEVFVQLTIPVTPTTGIFGGTITYTLMPEL
ncbi:MAG: hypothetical protein ABII03_01250 [Nanoarchaeota archaeon]|nr:hypothetical protein [Nanoarchaeota archaeon]